MTHLLERQLECEQRRLRMLRKMYAKGDPTVKAKEVIQAHQLVTSLHGQLSKKRAA